jgi:hypothetical protein
MAGVCVGDEGRSQPVEKDFEGRRVLEDVFFFLVLGEVVYFYVTGSPKQEPLDFSWVPAMITLC